MTVGFVLLVIAINVTGKDILKQIQIPVMYAKVRANALIARVPARLIAINPAW